jgi:hypothetical protein
MGMYDTVYSSYDLGFTFTGVECQTKDLDCLMQHYWIDPAGQLWEIDYVGTAEMQEDPNWVDDGSRAGFLFKYHMVPTGKHGKVRPVNITDYVSIYGPHIDGSWDTWPLCRIHFVNGKIQNYEIKTRSELGVWI